MCRTGKCCEAGNETLDQSKGDSGPRLSKEESPKLNVGAERFRGKMAQYGIPGTQLVLPSKGRRAIGKKKQRVTTRIRAHGNLTPAHCILAKAGGRVPPERKDTSAVAIRALVASSGGGHHSQILCAERD